ncbi:MAG: SUF system Fe-S cluster assembly protein [Gammaproteobacteria bacterium]|nr:SUF system Fe-S cluster assembly protein [Gammaproteobacteria bacterium]
MSDEQMDEAQPHAHQQPKGSATAGNGALEDEVVRALRNVYDPEIPVNIYDLGLIYEIDIDADNMVSIKMTLTAPGCPVAQTFPGTVESAVREVEGVTDAAVELVWDPPWDMSRMSEAARLQLNMF